MIRYLIFIIIAFLLFIDFHNRILNTNEKKKDLEMEIIQIHAYKQEKPADIDFKEHLFGQVIKEKTIIDEPVKKKPKAIFKPRLRAIYLKPEPYILVDNFKKGESLKKMTINDDIKEFKLINISLNEATFEKQGEKYKFRVFKR